MDTTVIDMLSEATMEVLALVIVIAVVGSGLVQRKRDRAATRQRERAALRKRLGLPVSESGERKTA